MDVIGTTYFLGLTIETVSCMCLVLGIGFCVDYCVHIAHAFGVASGNSERRVKIALTEMGPAILNGGTTTFIGFSLLCVSNYYGFTIVFNASYDYPRKLGFNTKHDITLGRSSH